MDSSEANYILTKPIHSSQRIVNINEADNSMTFELEVVVNWELVSQLLGFGSGIKILEPASLAQQLSDIYKKALSQYRV